MTDPRDEALRACVEALEEAEGELYQVPPADFEQVRVLGVVRKALATARAALINAPPAKP